MVHGSVWFVHLHCTLEMNKVHNFVIFVSFVRCYMVRPVTRMNYVVCHQVVSGGVSSQLVKLQIFPGHAFYSVWCICSVVCQSSSPNRQGTDGTIVSFLCMRAFHLLFPVLSLTKIR